MTMPPITELVRQLAAGETTSLALTRAALDRAGNPAGEGARVFTMIDPELALEQAQASDAARAGGATLGPLAGIPISIKALFDIAGKTTHAASKVLADAPPATSDAVAVARLRAAGAVILGHTNMTEFAYSGLGLNPHYGTPGNPADRRRIPGGSSSGAAVSVADGMAAGALGTDTGGSCRIPAAFCGLVGFKPTARRVPTTGAFPLSTTLDSIGPITRTVADAALMDAVLAGADPAPLPTVDLAGVRLAVLDNYVLDDLEPAVAAAFEAALAALTRAGARIAHLTLPDLGRLPELNARGGIVAAEALARHRDLLATRGGDYDPRVAQRIRKALEQAPDEYDRLLAERQAMIARAAAVTGGYAAVLMPTTPVVAPEIAPLAADDGRYGRTNLLVLRNATVGNFLDRCAISVPLPVTGLPIGLMLIGETMADRALLALAASVATAVSA